MIACDDAVAMLWEYLEHELEPADVSNVEEHLARCLRCCGEVEFAGQLRRLLARSAQLELPSDVHTRFDILLNDLEDRGAPS